MLDDDAYRLLEGRLPVLGERKKDSQSRKVEDEVFDHPTLLSIYKLITDGHIKTIDFPISTGKEGNVFKGTAESGDVAVKIYRISNMSFKSISKYIIGDRRFKGLSTNRRKLLYAWTQKEYRNLCKMQEHGMRVPSPVAYENNILVMEYIHTNGSPAPVLKFAPAKDPQSAADWVIGQAKKCYREAGLVHGDLSEFNILNTGEELVIIDVSQGVQASHPMAKEYLMRDLHNVSRYFSRLGVQVDPEAAYRDITRAPEPKEKARRIRPPGESRAPAAVGEMEGR